MMKMNTKSNRVSSSPLTIKQVLVLMSAPAIGWFALHLVYPVPSSHSYSPNLALLDGATIIACGLALICPVVLGLRQHRTGDLAFGEVVWIAQFAFVVAVFASYLVSMPKSA
jgi:hypothetical protein